ncbi:MAG: FHA domain-containing protein [Clostridia bacterium]|nr:FHA domain-containing protein [Clostridia bacterium]
MICNAKPYEGPEPFLFVSYCRKDSGITYPLIERLASAGVRLWFDSGIHGGEIWPEVIADHLNRSAACLVLMSQSAVKSHNCFNELIFAVENQKPLIPIRYNGAQLTMGMRLMIGSVQWIDVHDIPGDSVVTSILSLDAIKQTCGYPDRSIRIQAYQPGAGESEKPKPEKPKLPIDKLEHTAKKAPEPPIQEPEPAPAAETPEPVTPPVTDSGRHRRRRPIISQEEPGTEKPLPLNTDDDDGGTVAADYDDPLNKTRQDESEIPPTIVILSEDGVRYRGKTDVTRLGRTRGKADIVVNDPDRKVSGCHAQIVCVDGKHFIEDMNSTNGTWVNGERLEKEQKVPVGNLCEVTLFKQDILIAFKGSAETLWKAETLLCLRCEETDERKYLWCGEMKLGRNNPWKEGVLQSKKVSHNHAEILITENRCILKDLNSTNGTAVNGSLLEKGGSRELATGDVIRIDTNHFAVKVIKLTGGAGA